MRVRDVRVCDAERGIWTGDGDRGGKWCGCKALSGEERGERKMGCGRLHLYCTS